MSLKKDLLYPITVRIIVFGIISLGGYYFLSKTDFLKENSRTELSKSYKASNIALQKSLDAQERLFKEVEFSFLIRSDYFSNQIQKILEYNDDFINSEFTISVYGDSITKLIFKEIKGIIKDIDQSLYRYKKYDELLRENTPRLCEEGAYKKEAILKEQRKTLRAVIANENYFRQTIPEYLSQLNCGLEKLQNDYKRYLDEDYEDSYWKKPCRDESRWRYMNYYNEKYAYYHLQNDFTTELDLIIMDDVLEKIDSDYEIKMVLKSLEFCK